MLQDGENGCINGKACATCDFFERLGPQGPRSYCIDNFYNNPCEELKLLYYPDVDPNDLWGFHGTTDPNIIEFMNRHHEGRPVVTPSGELIIYPKQSSELPPPENPDPGQLLAVNNVGSADNLFGAADNTLGVVDDKLVPAESNLGLADSTFGVADSTLGPADDIFSTTDDLFNPVEANDAPINLFLDDYS